MPLVDFLWHFVVPTLEPPMGAGVAFLGIK